MTSPNESPSDTGADTAAASGRVSSPLAGLISLAAFAVPLVLSLSTSPSPAHPRTLLWYKSLRMPAFKPPDVAVPLAWTAIETALAFAAFRLLRRPGSTARNRALGWLGANVVAIGGWSRLFFGKRNLPASTIAAATMIGSGAAYVVEARKVDPEASAAGVPFVAWVAFATVLTAAIWRRNR